MSRVLITAQLRLFLEMTLLQPCCRDYKRFMIRHDKDLYKHNQNFMDGNKGFSIAHVWLKSGNAKEKTCRDFLVIPLGGFSIESSILFRPKPCDIGGAIWVARDDVFSH